MRKRILIGLIPLLVLLVAIGCYAIVLFFQFQQSCLHHLSGQNAAVFARGEHQHPLGPTDEARRHMPILTVHFVGFANELAQSGAQGDVFASCAEHCKLVGVVVEIDCCAHGTIVHHS